MSTSLRLLALFGFAVTAAAQAPMAPILGTVLTPEGAPAAGAVVTVARCDGRLFRCLDLQLRDEWHHVARARTDARGRFAMQVPLGLALRVDVDLPPFAHWRSLSVVPGEPLTVTLELPCTLQGRLVDATGKGTPGLLRAWDPKTQSEHFRARTGPDGAFRFERLPSGRFTCEIEPDACARPDWVEGEFTPGAAAPVEWRCPHGAELSGTVTDATTGAPLAHARVGLDWTFDKAVTTDAAGHYVLHGFGGRTVNDVHVDAPGYQRQRHDLDESEGAHTLDVALAPGVKVVGRLVTPDGEAVADAYVAAITTVECNIPWLATRSDARGQFCCDGFPRRSDGVLMIRRVGFASAVYSLPTAAGDGQIDFGTVVLVPPQLVQGTVVDGDGKPAVGVEVSLRGVNADMNRLADTPTAWGMLHFYCGERLARTGADGRFAFGDVGPGAYDVAIGSVTQATPASESIEVTAEKPVPMLRLER